MEPQVSFLILGLMGRNNSIDIWILIALYVADTVLGS